MNIKIEIDEKQLKGLVYAHLINVLGDIKIKPECISVLVKSKQNYKSEWENAAFKAVYETNT